MVTRALSGLALALAPLTLGACEAILAIPERTLDPNIACEGGGCTCKAGFQSCDGDTSNGCEVDLNNDSLNCGSCGKGCLGGMCEQGRCQPVVLVDTAYLSDIALDGGFIYYINYNNGPLYRVRTEGGNPEPILGSGPGFALRILDGLIYYTTLTQIVSIPTTGAAEPTVVADGVDAYDMAIGGGRVYFVNFDPVDNLYRLMAVPITGGTPQLIDQLNPLDSTGPVITDADRVYWGVFGKVVFAPHDTLVPALFATTNGFPYFFAIDAMNLYWLVNGVFKAPLPLGAPKELADSGPIGTLSIDQTHVYFLTQEGAALRKVPIEGGDVVELATEQLFYGLNMPVDNEAIYWLVNNRILKVAK